MVFTTCNNNNRRGGVVFVTAVEWPQSGCSSDGVLGREGAPRPYGGARTARVLLHEQTKRSFYRLFPDLTPCLARKQRPVPGPRGPFPPNCP